MIENNNVKHDRDTQGRSPIWIAKAFLFLRTFYDLETGVYIVGTDRNDSTICNDKAPEYYFVQYYDPIKGNQRRFDGIYKALECVKMEFNKTPGETGACSAEKESGLTLACAVRDSLLIVQLDVAAKFLSASGSRQPKVQ